MASRSIIHRLVSRLYPTQTEYTVTILGLDYAGKTTLTYLLKLGEVIKTYPSMGMNIETVDAPTVTGTLKMQLWDIGVGCGGMRYLKTMLRPYASSSNALIWIVDSTDRGRLQESVETLGDLLKDLGKEMNAKGMPILILANKSDLPNAMSIDDIRIPFSKVTSSRVVSVFKTSLTLDVMSGGLPQAFEWLQIVLEMPKPNAKTKDFLPVVETIPDPRSTNTLTEKLVVWLTRVEHDAAPEDFINQFESLCLPEWDHYTHIRIAYTALTMHGRSIGKNMIFEGIKKYIEQSKQTTGRTFHFTMTYFWIQIVHYGIRSTPPAFELSNDKGMPSTSNVEGLSPSIDDFIRFLISNPFVADGNLWQDYYSKDVLMGPEARQSMVLPDKHPLPSIAIRDTIMSFGNKSR